MSNLPREARQILARLELVSHGSITGYNKSGGARTCEHPGGKRPAGEAEPPHLTFRARMVDEPWKVWDLIEEAEKHLERIVKGNPPKTEGISDRDIVLNDAKGFSPKQVSQRYGYSESLIRKWRTQDGKDSEDGLEVREIAVPDRLAEAIAMRKQGASFRTIEMRTRVSKSTLFDAMRRAA
jgi:transposase-like protein